MSQDNGMPLDRLISTGDEKPAAVRDKYEIVVEGEEADLTGNEGGPLVRVPSSNAAHHGGSHGFNHKRGVSITADCNGLKYTIPNLLSLPKEAQQKISQELAAYGLDAANDGADFGKVIAKVFKKHLAAEYKGEILPPLKTWVNGGRDPFKNPVNLPESKIVTELRPPAGKAKPILKGASADMNHPHLTPDQAAAFSSFQPDGIPNARVPVSRQVSRAPVVPQPAIARQREAVLPPPSKVVVFGSSVGNIRVKYHSVILANGEPILNEANQFVTPQYLALSKNHKAEGSDDHFTPSTPAPGTRTTITLADNSVYELGYVMLSFKIGTVEHLILCVSDVPVSPQAEPEVQAVDPLYAEPEIEPLTEEDAVAGGLE